MLSLPTYRPIRCASHRHRRSAKSVQKWIRPSLRFDELEERRLLAASYELASLAAVSPLGSLVYDGGSQTGHLTAPGDSQALTIAVDPGQTLTVLVDPSEGLQATVELTGPTNTSLAAATGTAAGQNVLLQSVSAAEGGTYTVIVGQTAGTTGDFDVRVILNAALEKENVVGPANNNSATAQNLDSSFSPLESPAPAGSRAERAAVLGRLRGGAKTGDVFFTEYQNSTVIQLDSEGHERARLTHPLLTGGSLCDVEQGIHNDLYVVVSAFDGSGRLLRFDYAGDLLDTITLPTHDGLTYDEAGLDVAADGSLWVTQVYANEIHHLDATGNLLSSIPFSPEYPRDVAVRDDGQLFVTSGGNGGVWQVDPATGEATLFADVSQPYGLNFTPEGELTVGARYDGIFRFDGAGNQVQSLPVYSALDPQVDPMNAIWSTMFDSWRVEKYDSNGLLLAGVPAVYPWGLAVIGVDGPDASADMAPDPGDWYSLTLEAGQSMTAALKSLGYGQLVMELQDAEGSRLAIGASDASNLDQVIRNFVAPATGIYYLQVSGQATEYSLVTSRDADFDSEPNDDLGVAQELSGTDIALGYIANGPGPGYGSAMSDFNIGGGGVFDPIGNQFTGTLDEVAIWDVALSGAEIDSMVGAALTDGGNFAQTVLDTSPIGYWRFNETGGDTALNLGSAGALLDGTYMGGQRGVAGPDETQGQPLLGLGADNVAYAVGPAESFVHVAASPLNNLRQFSFAAWVNRETLTQTRVGLFGQNDVIEFGFIDPTTIQVWTPNGGQANFYFSEGALPSGDWFHLAAVGDGDSLALYVNGQLVQYGGWTIPPATQDWDDYLVEVNEGDTLVVQTQTPGGDLQQPDQFHNDLDPTIELYDPLESWVASDENSGSDGRNAALAYTALMTGTYRVRVLGAEASRGEYVLRIDGATGSLPEFNVLATDLPDGARLRGPLTQVMVDFNDAILLSSLEASDLTLNGVPAIAVTVVDANTAVFDLPAHGEGSQQLQIESGALRDLQGTPVAAFSSTFTEDVHPPTVIASSIHQGEVLPAGSLTYTVQFSEEMSLANFDNWDFQLQGKFLGVSYGPDSSSWDSTNTQLTIEYTNLPDDAYTLTLLSGDFVFEDLVGFNLDGERPATSLPPYPSGDGMEGGNFSVDFSLDVRTAPFPTPLTAQRPLGSLIYESSVHGAIVPSSDSDRYTLRVDPGQTITVVVDPSATLQPKVELFRFNGKRWIRVGRATADGAGEDAVLQTLRAQGDSGDKPQLYKVKISGAHRTSGGYHARLILNSAVESESHDGPANDRRATAQDLTPSLIALHSDSPQGSGPARAAVLGQIRGGVRAGDVFFTEQNSGDLVHIDSEGREQSRITHPRLAEGSLFDVEQGIHDDLYVSMAVYGGPGQVLHFDYEGNLLDTIVLPNVSYDYYGTSLDVARDGSLWVTQPYANLIFHLDSTGNLLAEIPFSPSLPSDVAVRDDGLLFVTSHYGSGVYQVDPATGEATLFADFPGDYGLNFTPEGELTVAGYYAGIARFDHEGNLLQSIPSYSSIDPQVDLQNNLWVALLDGYGLEKYDPEGSPLLRTAGTYYYPRGLAVIGVDGPEPPASLAPDSGDFYSLNLRAGQSVSLTLKSLTGGQIAMELQKQNGTVLAMGSPGATNAEQVVGDFVVPATGTYFIRVTGDPQVQYSLVATRNAEFDTEPNNDLGSAKDVQSSEAAGRQWVMGFVGAAEDGWSSSDFYRVTMAERKTLELETMTRAAGSGEFVNVLNPMLRVYDAFGNLVASNDNATSGRPNAKLSYRVPRGAGGTYFVEVAPSDATAELTGGEYTMSIKGATGKLPPFNVSDTSPIDGSRTRGPTRQITVSFNDGVLLTSLQPADLKINGIPAVGVSAIDGNTVVFDLPQLNEGPQRVRIATGAMKDVQGTPLDAFEMNFVEDLTPPRVISSSIQPGDVLPAGDLTYVVEFSEPMRTDNLYPWNVPLQELDGSAIYSPNGYSFDASGTTLTLQYSGLPEGSYRLTLISAGFEDLASPDGFDLDGEPPVVSGNGTEGGDFSVEFDLDIDTLAFPTPLSPKAPLGSLIYDPVVSGLIRPAGDSDSWTLPLDAGQTITVVVEPGSGLQPRVELFDPSGESLGVASAAVVGHEAVLQTIPITTAGTYTATVGGVLETSGSFQLQIILNAAVESESHDGPANDTRATAQDLTASFLALDSSPADGSGPERAAVLGQIRAGVLAGEVFFIESYNGDLVHLDSAGNELARINHPALASGVLQDVEQGAGDELFVALTDASGLGGRLLHFDYDGKLLDTIPLPEVYFSEAGLDVAADGSLWVALSAVNEVLHLDSSGQLLASYGFPFGYPADVAVRDDGQVFVTSVYSWGVWQLDPTTGDYSQFAQVNYPYGLNFTPDGDLTVASFYDGIYRFDSAGNQQEFIPTYSVTDPQVDVDGQIWAQSLYGGYVGKYDAGGNLLVSIPASNARGLAVIGVDGPAPSASLAPDSGDFYAVTLSQGQSLTVGLQVLNRGTISLELQDEFGNTILFGDSNATNLDQVIRDFEAPVTGTFYLRVTGDRNVEYSLVVTREAAFDIEDNNTTATAQELGTNDVVLGAIQKDTRTLVDSYSGGLLSGEGLVVDDGTLYVVSRGTNSILRYDASSGEFLGVLVADSGLTEPLGMILGTDGNLYVSNPGANNVLRFDPVTGASLGEFVAAGSGGLSYPTGLAFGPDGSLYVASRETSSILRYDGATGAYLDTFVASESGGLYNPYDLTFGPDNNLYASVPGTNSIVRFDGSTGEPIDTFVSSFSGGLAIPEGLRFGPDGNLYVSSYNSAQVLRYQGPMGTEPGAFVEVFLSWTEVSFYNPTAMTIDSAGSVYVSSQGTQSIVRATDRPDVFRVHVVAGEQVTITTTTPGDGPGEFVNALDAVLRLYDADGNVIASDDNGAADGRNALLDFTAPTEAASDLYYLEVTSAAETSGEYVLSIERPSAAVQAVIADDLLELLSVDR